MTQSQIKHLINQVCQGFRNSALFPWYTRRVHIAICRNGRWEFLELTTHKFIGWMKKNGRKFSDRIGGVDTIICGNYHLRLYEE